MLNFIKQTPFGFLLIFAAFCCIASCKPPIIDEKFPPNFSYFFVVKDKATGKDYFLDHANYKKDKLRFIHCDGGNSFKPTIDSTRMGHFNKIECAAVVFNLLCIDFGNGDIDTIRQVWSPNIEPLTSLSDYTSFKIYYNDSLVKVFDFEHNPSLREELPKRNNTHQIPWANDPILIELPKK